MRQDNRFIELDRIDTGIVIKAFLSVAAILGLSIIGIWAFFSGVDQWMSIQRFY